MSTAGKGNKQPKKHRKGQKLITSNCFGVGGVDKHLEFLKSVEPRCDQCIQRGGDEFTFETVDSFKTCKGCLKHLCGHCIFMHVTPCNNKHCKTLIPCTRKVGCCLECLGGPLGELLGYSCSEKCRDEHISQRHY